MAKRGGPTLHSQIMREAASTGRPPKGPTPMTVEQLSMTGDADAYSLHKIITDLKATFVKHPEWSKRIHVLEGALEETGCEELAELIDMAKVGLSLMDSIHLLTKDPGPFHNWTPADDPAEIVFDLVNHYEDQQALSTRPSPGADVVEAVKNAHMLLSTMLQSPFWKDAIEGVEPAIQDAVDKLTQALSTLAPPKPVKMLVDDNWLRERTEGEPDGLDCEAAPSKPQEAQAGEEYDDIAWLEALLDKQRMVGQGTTPEIQEAHNWYNARIDRLLARLGGKE